MASTKMGPKQLNRLLKEAKQQEEGFDPRKAAIEAKLGQLYGVQEGEEPVRVQWEYATLSWPRTDGFPSPEERQELMKIGEAEWEMVGFQVYDNPVKKLGEFGMVAEYVFKRRWKQ